MNPIKIGREPIPRETLQQIIITETYNTPFDIIKEPASTVTSKTTIPEQEIKYAQKELAKTLKEQRTIQEKNIKEAYNTLKLVARILRPINEELSQIITEQTGKLQVNISERLSQSHITDQEIEKTINQKNHKNNEQNNQNQHK